MLQKKRVSHVSGVIPWLFIKRDATWAHQILPKMIVNPQ